MTPAARSTYNRAYYATHAEERRAYQAGYRKKNRDRLNATRRAKYSLDEEYRSKEKERKKVKKSKRLALNVMHVMTWGAGGSDVPDASSAAIMN